MATSKWLVAVALSVLSACATQKTDDEVARMQIAPRGKLRVGIIVGPNASPFSATRNPTTGQHRGVTVALGEYIAQELSVPFDLVPYSSAGALSQSATTGAWDITFMAINPEREKVIKFGSPYVLSGNTYVVPASSSMRRVEDVDRPGVRVIAQSGSSSVLLLRNVLKHAKVIEAGSLNEAYNMMIEGKADAIAGARQTLMSLAAKQPGARVLHGNFHESVGAVGVPVSRSESLPYASALTNEAKRAGVVTRALENDGLTGAIVAP